MTLTTQIRFTAPIDPREVWTMAQRLVGVPDDYRWEHVVTGSERWQVNDELRADADQGAGALLWLEYGHEGSPLRDPDAQEREEEGAPPLPEAYVELCIDTPYGADVDHRPWIELVLAWARVHESPALWWQGECCEVWHDSADAGRYTTKAAR